MPNVSEFLHSSPVLGMAVTVGSFAIWLGLASSATCVALYWIAMIRSMRAQAPAAAAPAEAADHEPNGSNGANGKSGGRKNGSRRAKSEPVRGPSPEEQKTDRIGLWARRFFFITCGFAVIGALSLWTLIFKQDYTVVYIWKNSNAALPFGYRFASFWSDQEGTFFLWALYNAVIGSILLWKARQDERWVMPFFALIHVSLFTLLTFMNPFWMVSPGEVRHELNTAMQNAGLAAEDMKRALSFLPTDFWGHVSYYFGWAKYWKITDGKGLNESLQNFWMVIHPPTLFVGFSSMIVPGCFAMGALMRRDYDNWVNRAAPWLMFAWTVLGFGIFLGAYWAYETLGWGGYWSWDPVENSSLLPWLAGTTLVHGLLAQRNRGNYKQANLFIGLMTGNLVLLSSFLNRSGVLSETSVHSFASPQRGVFITLLVVMVLWFVLSVALWLWRFKEIQAEIAYEHVWERHFGFFLGLIVLCATTIVVAFGVTAPIWMPKLGSKITVEYTFYNKALLPVVFVMVLLMALTPLMPWKQAREGGRPLKTFHIVCLGLAAVFTIFFVFAAIWAWQGGFRTQNDLAYVGFGLAVGLALLVNGVQLARSARGGLLQTGPWLAHIGFIVMLAGVVITSRFNSVHPIASLPAGQSVTLLNRKFTFMGARPAANPADRDRMLIDVQDRSGKVIHLDPKVFIPRNSDPEKPSVMAWPQILNMWFSDLFGDLYVEPSGTVGYNPVAILQKVKVGDPNPTATTAENETEDRISLAVANWTAPRDAAPGEAPAMVADVLLDVNGVRQNVQARLEVDQQGFKPKPVPVQGFRSGTGHVLMFMSVDPRTRTGTFALAVPVGSFQVLHVPGIHILWFGCYIMFAGGFLCYRRRAKLAGKLPPVKISGQSPASRPPQAAEPVGAE